MNLRLTFWSLARVSKGHYWTAYWTGSPIDDPGREPDTKGKSPTADDAEKSAREAIRASQSDWRFQVVRTLDRFAEAQAIIDGLKLFVPTAPKRSKLPPRHKPFAESLEPWNTQKVDRRIEEIHRENEWKRLREQSAQRLRDEFARQQREEFNRLFNALRPTKAFEILGVADTATVDEIKRAFRRKALECHPDRGGKHEDFCRLNDAYQQAIKERTL